MKHLFTLSLLFISTCCVAQNNKEYVSNTRMHAIKFDATKLIEPEQNISVAYEQRLQKNKYGVQLQLDYIFDAYTQNTYNSVNFSEKGIRVIPEFRYYTGYNSELTEPYIGLQILSKYAIKNYEEWTTQADAAGTEFAQLKPVQLSKLVIAPHFMVGWHFFLTRDKRLSIDFNVGVGGRARFVTKSVTNNVPRDYWSLNEDKNMSSLSVASNLKLCYFFNGK
jgi:Protein of unknown function (DUF3575)